MNGRTGLAVAAGAFALMIALPQSAEAGRGASTRSDGGVSSGGTSSGSSSHSSSSGSSAHSGSSSSHASSGSSTGGSWGGSSHATGTSKPTRDEGGATNDSHDTGRTAVPRPGAGEVAGRQPSHGGRSHDGHHRGGYYYGGRYYDPWYGYGGYPYGWGWGWRAWWWPWGPGGVIYDGPYHRGARGSGYGALDIDIWPGETEVYVDGERVGTADDFDGFPTYLWLPHGTYDVVFYLDGFQTLARQYSIYDGLVIDVNDRLERGEAIRPEDLPAKSTVNRDDRLRRDSERAESARRREDWRRRQDESDLPPAMDAPAAPSVDDDGGGNAARLRLDVSPDDASIYLDGNFLGTASELEGLSAGLVVTPGSHRLEVVRPGYQAEDVAFEGTPGQEVQLEVSLDEE